MEVVNGALDPIRSRYQEIRNSKELVDSLKEGAEKASEIAERTMKRVKKNMGLGL